MNNPDHQQLEVRLLEALNEHNAEHRKTMAVVFEMLDASQQENIDAMTTALADNADLELSVEQMRADLDWPEQGWMWEDYDNVIGWVLDNRVPMYAGNIDSTQMQSVLSQRH